MLTKELVPTLADLWGVPQATAGTIDRSLADAGFRRKWKGPRPPNMTRREGLHLLIACLAAEHATRAGEETAAWIRARCHYPTFHFSPDDSEYFEEFREMARLGRAVDALLAPFATPAFPGASAFPAYVCLTDFLLVVCHLVEAGRIKPHRWALEANLSQRTASIEFFGASDVANVNPLRSPTFDCGDHRRGQYRPTLITRDLKAEAPGLAVGAIIDRTADPLAPGAAPETDWKGHLP